MKHYHITSDKEECRKIWNKHVPLEKHLYESWEYNILFHNSLSHDLYFISQNTLFIPLVQEKITGKFSCFPENRYQHIVYGNEEEVEEILQQLEGEKIIEDILIKQEISTRYKKHDNLYFLDLQNIGNWEDYISRFKSEKKSKIRTQYRKCISQGFEIHTGKVSDLEKLFQYNIENFGEQSDFRNAHFQNAYRQLFQQSEFNHFILLIKKEGEVCGVSYLLGYKDELHYMNVGIDKSQRDIGKILFLSCINLAIENKYSSLNLGGGNCGWKENWECETIPLYTIV